MKYLAAKLGHSMLIGPMRSIFLERRTGILEIEGPEPKKRLYFVDGELYLLRSELPLARRISACLETVDSRSGSSAATTDLRDLTNMIGEHWTAWNATSCRFVEGLGFSAGSLVGPLPTARLLIAAARAARTEDDIVDELGGPDQLVVAVPDGSTPPGSIVTRPAEALLLELCREPIRLGDIMARANGDGGSIRETLARLWVTGLLRTHTAKESAAQKTPAEGADDPSPTTEEPATEEADSRAQRIWRDYFRLSGDPFSLTPDPAFLFLSKGHSEALAALEVGLLERRGLTVLTGEVGTGKTTLLYALLSDIGTEVETAFVANTTLSFDEILMSALSDLGVEPASSARLDLLEALNEFLLACDRKGRTVALVVDEAHQLSAEAFEGLRQLLNFETYEKKLLQIFLVGQPELGVRLREQGLRQVADRIAVRCDLQPLKRGEARKYIEHRLESAGAVTPLFNRWGVDLVIRESRGIPRSINVLCHNAMLFAFAQGQILVSRSTVREAVRERRGTRPQRSSWGWSLGASRLTALLLLAFAVTWGGFSLARQEGESAPTQIAAPARLAEPEGAAVPVETPRTSSAQTAELDTPLSVPSAKATETETSTVRVTTANLNLRSGPSLDKAVLTTLPVGTEVLVLTNEGEWSVVLYDNQSGWVNTDYLALPSPPDGIEGSS